MGVWATVSDVKSLTGADVTELTRTLAAQAIELKTGAIEVVTTARTLVSDRDQYWLKLAVCYQAAWLNEQPDYLERSAVANLSQDGQSATMGNPDWLVLAPLARTAIKRLSWRGARQLNLGRVGTVRPIFDNTTEEYENRLDWRPL
jgi:hypothetical protein